MMAHAWEGRAVALQLHCHRSALKAIAGIPPLRRRRVGNAPHAISFLQELLGTVFTVQPVVVEGGVQKLTETEPRWCRLC